MSKNFKGYMGDQIGKLGPAVGRRWMGKMVYASYQGRVKNPRTSSQQMVRARFKVLSELTAAFDTALALGLKKVAYSRSMTAANLFVSLNYANVSGTVPTALDVAYEGLTLSRGRLAGMDFGTPSFATPSKVEVDIEDNQLDVEGTSADDTVVLVAYNPAAMYAVVGATAKRTDESVSLGVPKRWQGLQVHVYAFVRNSQGEVSDTVYVGSGVIN